MKEAFREIPNLIEEAEEAIEEVRDKKEDLLNFMDRVPNVELLDEIE